MTGILIKYGLIQFFPFVSVGGFGVTPPHLYFHLAWLGEVLKTAVNNSPLRWLMHEGNNDGVDLWSWLKVKYGSATKLNLLRQFYGEKIWSIKLKSGGLLGD